MVFLTGVIDADLNYEDILTQFRALMEKILLDSDDYFSKQKQKHN
jgi:hypothetical protein